MREDTGACTSDRRGPQNAAREDEASRRIAVASDDPTSPRPLAARGLRPYLSLRFGRARSAAPAGRTRVLDLGCPGGAGPEGAGITPVTPLRRGGRVVECTGLLSRHTRKGIAGSNPALSAISPRPTASGTRHAPQQGTPPPRPHRLGKEGRHIPASEDVHRPPPDPKEARARGKHNCRRVHRPLSAICPSRVGLTGALHRAGVRVQGAARLPRGESPRTSPGAAGQWWCAPCPSCSSRCRR